MGCLLLRRAVFQTGVWKKERLEIYRNQSQEAAIETEEKLKMEERYPCYLRTFAPPSINQNLRFEFLDSKAAYELK